MAVPPISPVKNEVSSTDKRKRAAASASQSPTAGAGSGDASVVPSPKRSRNCGVRVVGGRVCHPEHGKTCHQCRQKTADFSAACNNVARRKPCPIRFCHKCLRNRYGEKAEEVAGLEGWNCPKCRGICNCSLCMKKKGQLPTGILVHTARATGHSSVSEMLQLYQATSEVKRLNGDAATISTILPAPREHLVAPGKAQGNENSHATSKVKRKMVKGAYTLKSSEKKVKSMDVGFQEKGKISKTKRKETNGAMSSPTEIHTRAKAVAIKVTKGDSGRCRKNNVDDERGASSSDRIRKEVVKAEGKTGCNREMHVCGGANSNGDSGKCVSKELKNCAKMKQMDLRTVLSGGNRNDVLNRKMESNAESEGSYAVQSASIDNSSASGVVLPEGTQLTAIAGIDIQAEDIGPALQFLEFCRAFGKVLGIKKGQPESILRDLVCGRNTRRGANSLIVQFYVKFLSRILKKGERSTSCAVNGENWPKALKSLITESERRMEDLPLNWVNKGASGYALLDQSEKLKLLNFLCDELLGTQGIRDWIDKENKEFIEEKKDAQRKVLSAKEEEKRLKQKMRDKVAEAMIQRNGAFLTISEHTDLVSRIKAETVKAHSEVLCSLDILRKKKLRSDAVRTQPILLEGDGRVYWRLKGYDSSRIVRQDIGNWEPVTAQDKWFTYNDEQKKYVERHIHFSRNRKPMP